MLIWPPLLLLSVQARAATLISDNFNSENGGSGISNYTGFTNWTANGVDLNGNGFNDVLRGNGWYANITGAISSLRSKSA